MKKSFLFVIQKWILPQKISTLTPYSKLWGQSTGKPKVLLKVWKKMEKWKMKKSFLFVIQKWILAQNISTLTPYSKLWGQSTVET